MIQDRLFMLMKGGRVQYVRRGNLNGLVIAEDRQTIKAFARFCGSDAVVAEIGTVEGETLEQHARRSLRAGATAVFIVAECRII
jgi:hypothetical protein